MCSCSYLDNGSLVTNIVYVCPTLEKCEWSGFACQIENHFRDKHEDLFATESYSINVDAALEDNEKQNRLMVTSCGKTFLVQECVHRDDAKLSIRLRLLGNVEDASRLRYSVEVSVREQFGFTNELFLDATNNEEVYSPVYNVPDGVEVDLRAIRLINNARLDRINIKFKIREVEKSIPYETEPISEEISESFLLIDKGDFIQNYLDSPTTNDIEESDDDKNTISPKQNSQNSFTFTFDQLDQITKDLPMRRRHNDVEMLLKCIKCKASMIPPIYTCPTGHAVCASCQKYDCPLCLQKITTIRHAELEERSRTFEYRCKYENRGCMRRFRFDQIRTHEIYCIFFVHRCEQCSFEDRLDKMAHHYRIAHPSTKQYYTTRDVSFVRGSTFVIIANQMGIFYGTCVGHDHHIEWKINYSGPTERSYTCAIHIVGKKNKKEYVLKRTKNVFKLKVDVDELKRANVKDKNAKLCII